MNTFDEPCSATSNRVQVGLKKEKEPRIRRRVRISTDRSADIRSIRGSSARSLVPLDLCVTTTAIASGDTALRPQSAAFLQADGLANATTQEVQLGPSDDAGPLDDDLFDARRVERELSFDSFSGDDPPNGERFIHSGACAGDHGAREDLDPFLVSLEDLRVDVDRIANFKLGWFRLEAILVDKLH